MRLLPILLLFSQTASAQTADTVRRRPHNAFSVEIQYAGFNFDDFNTRVKQAGLPELPAGANSMGGFTLAYGDYHQKFFADIAFSGKASQQEANNVTLAYQILMLDFNINAVVVQKGRHFVIPSVGFGFGGFSARYTQNNIGLNFSQSLTAFNGERSFETTTNYYLHPKLAYHYALNKGGNFLLGVKAGYRIGLNKGQWNLPYQNGDTEGAPQSSASGFFAGIALTATF